MCDWEDVNMLTWATLTCIHGGPGRSSAGQFPLRNPEMIMHEALEAFDISFYETGPPSWGRKGMR
eukprot:5675040-Prymnesium_polylepis.1